jgi:acyl-CoA synthetase (AMP-forming)/AMP-acid ligase II
MHALEHVAHRAGTAAILVRAGVVRPAPPDRLVRAARALHRWGPTLATGAIISAIRHPDRTAIVNERGRLTWRQVDERSNALARALRARGLSAGDGVAILCRNHRGFIDATLAAMKLGLTGLYLNTMFAGPQIAEVVRRERPKAIIHDAEFAALSDEAAVGLQRYLAWPEDASAPPPGGGGDAPLLDELIAESDTAALDPPSRKGRVIILTSGTTGAPKGAQRNQPESVDPVAALLSKIPLRALEPTMIAAPLFHSWGMAHFALATSLSSTVVLTRRFEPEPTLAAVASNRCTVLVVVPIMLSRILELPAQTLDRFDLSHLRVIAASGSSLAGELTTRVMDRFGDVLYNLYGSTEVAWATIATPSDLRAAPGTAGRAPRGTVVRILGDDGRELAPGRTGRIFVGNEMMFEGYTGGESRDLVDGLMSPGDVGHFDAAGRLFVDGRADEMIVSGGENVFPREVEDLLAGHEDVEEVAVVGVDDAHFGQWLRAFVVPRAGRRCDEDALKEHVRRNLAGYKVPREIVFLDQLPRNATGKVVKRELPDRAARA